MGSVTFEDFLKPDYLTEAAKDLIQTFRERNPQYANTKVPLPQLLEEWERENGPIISHKSTFTYMEHSYLIPINDDGGDEKKKKFIELARPEGLDTLAPMIPNPCLCSRAALPFMAAIPNLKELVKEVTQKESGRQRLSSTTGAPEALDQKELFSIDTIGTETVSVNDELKRTLGKRHEVIMQNNHHQQALVDDGETTITKGAAENSIKNFLYSHGGRPINGKVIEKAGTPILGYKDVQTIHKNTLNTSNNENSSSIEIPLIRELIEDKSLEPRNRSDKVDSKRKRKEASENIKDAWFGMSRRMITPEDRAEFKAIDLRGYVEGVNTYRGGKRRFDLSTAESGFFQYGVVQNAGLEKAIGEDTLVMTRPDKRKKSKSLVKSLIVK